MAFTEAQKLKICRICDITADVLEDVLTFRGVAITAQVESDVDDLIEEYHTGNTRRNTTEVTPTAKGFGAKINPESLRALIRKDIINMLYLQDAIDKYGLHRNQGKLIRA